MRSVMICGATGFIGSHLMRQLIADGKHVVGVGRRAPTLFPSGGLAGAAEYRQVDLSDSESVLDLVREVRADAVVLAAGPADVQGSMKAPLRDLREQLTPVSVVLDALRLDGQTPRTLLISSAAVYGEPKQIPVREDQPLAPLSSYGYHKVMQETLVEEYHRVFGLPTCRARVFSTFGPELRRLAVHDLFQRACVGDYLVRGTGEEVRDYLYVEDLCRALASVLDRSAFLGEAINVGSGTGIFVRDLAGLIFSAVNSTEEPRFDGVELAGSPRVWVADVSALGALGFEPRVGVKEGIARTIAWMRAND